MSIKTVFCMFLLLIGLVLVNTVQFGFVGADTNVSGIISSDTTWTQENSRYIVTAPLRVNPDVTLTIEPGVTVYFIDSYLRVNGTLNARGTSSNPIRLIRNGTEIFPDNFDDATIQFTSTSTSWNYSIGSIIENAVINSTQPCHTIYIDNVSPKINNCTVINSGHQRAIWISGGAPVISNCVIISDFVGITCGLTSETLAFISQNTISAGEVGIEIYSGFPVVEKNLIINCGEYVVSVDGGIRVDNEETKPLIQNNTLFGNILGVCVINSAVPTIKYNNFIANTEYDIYLFDDSTNNVDAGSNYWGTSNASKINQLIYDFYDDFNLGTVDYAQFLTGINQEAPQLPIYVSFQHAPETKYAYGGTQFDATESLGEYSSIVDYTWNFGDGNITSTALPVINHDYTEPDSYVVTLTVTDEYGFTNSTSTTVVVLEDDVPPTTGNNYDGTWHSAEFTVVLTASDQETGVVETYYKVNDGETKAVSVDGQPVITTEGADNTLEYWSIDKAGNVETHKTVTAIKLDKSAPVSAISLEGALGDNGWYVSDVVVTLSATDSVSGVQITEYSLDNLNWSTYSAPFTVSDEGDFLVYCRSTDHAGNMETAKTEAGKLDKTAPSGTVTINENAEYTNTPSVTLTLTIQDTVSGVNKMRFSNDNIEWGNWEENSTTKQWTLEGNDGTKTVYVQFNDQAGIVSEAYQSTITLDTTDPAADAGEDQTVEINSQATFDATASSDNMEIASYNWDFGYGATGTGETTTYTYTADGTYTVTLTVTDAAGNTDSTQITVTALQPELLPTWIIAVIAVVIIAVAVAVVLLRRK